MTAAVILAALPFFHQQQGSNKGWLLVLLQWHYYPFAHQFIQVVFKPSFLFWLQLHGLAPDGQLICHFEVVLVLGVGDAPYIRLLNHQEGLIGEYLLIKPLPLLIRYLLAEFNPTKCQVPPL